MVVKECNSRAGVYKVQTFGTTQASERASSSKKCFVLYLYPFLDE